VALDLVKDVASLEGENFNTSISLSVHLKFGLIRSVDFGGNGLIRGTVSLEREQV
jgi:hypothetical protein